MSTTQKTLRQLLEGGVLFDFIVVPPDERIYQSSSTGPLANTKPRTTLMPATIKVPEVIRLFCSNEKCLSEMDWALKNGPPIDNTGELERFHSARTYVCRHTPEDSVTFFLRLTRSELIAIVELVGRDPKPTPFLPKEIRASLGDVDQDRYSKAVSCRSGGLGIAAVAYMRRVVEGEMDRLLDFLIEVLPDEDEAVRAELQRVKGGHQFSEKAAVADARLPPSFFPGNQNPFARLHDLTSQGIHLLDDAESCKRFDECRDLFELLFERMLRERDTQRLYRDRLTKIQGRSKK